MMLIIPAPPERAAQPAFGLGSTCRTCQRQACPARREPSILASAPAPSPARG
jgi:predicted transcriptional regulator